ncbi:AAA family ATPase [Desulfobacterales bacterium HSG16]|nr:AAA family ATPase [Desulfobacterales bacterium HSG16]
MIEIFGYRTLSKIHAGTETEVFRGIHNETEKPVIFKVTKDNYPSPELIARFRHEYEIILNLDQEGIVHPIGMEKCKNKRVIIFEDIGGDSLKKNMAERILSLEESLEIAIEITQSLAEVHSTHIIHKDINPSNIIYCRQSKQVAIIDFGISTILTCENTQLKSPDVLEGTLAYISPEQTGRMNSTLDYRCDFYSLGVTLYELFTHRLPFTTTDPLELLHCHIAKRPDSPCEINSETPKNVSEIILKLMAKNPKERYQSASGIKHDLVICLDHLRSGKKISGFLPGANDFSDVFHIPLNLYGREKEIESIREVFDRVIIGKREMVLVSGYSGVGKSVLVKEIFKHISIDKSRFNCISGKFDQLQRDIPYSALAKAFRDLVRQLLTESSDRLAVWRKRLQKALGENGKIITEMIPEVEQIIGVQPEVSKLPSSEARNRFNMIFSRFIRVFCSHKHPLAIFIDDLQWADAATLKLIELVMTDEENNYLFFIGAYRENEVNSTHPLMTTLDDIHEQNIALNRFRLSPLSLKHIISVISDTVHDTGEQVNRLARLVIRKTGGNPFFVNRFLDTLYREDLINFDMNKKKWRWDMARIESTDITDNVVELMIRKLKKLEEGTRKGLRLAACIGNNFYLLTLAVIHENSGEDTFKDLLPAVREGLIIPTSGKEILDTERIDAIPVFVSFKFLHDRVQQAAYALIDPLVKNETHLKIGRLLLANLSEGERAEKIFELTDHLNLGFELITDEQELLYLAELNLEAGKKAKAAMAYEAARQYIKAGIDCLNESFWNERYYLTLSLYMECAELEYLNGDFDRSEAWIDVILNKATSGLDKAEAYSLLIVQYTMLGKNEEAVMAAKKSLGFLSIHMPSENIEETLDIKKALDAELAKVKNNLGNRPVASLIDLPEMTSPEKKMTMKVLMTVHTAAYFANQLQLYAWILARMTNISLKYGHVPESSKGYASFGNTLAGGMGEFQTGYEFGMLGIRLSEKYGHHALTCKACLIMSMFLNHWVRHIKHAMPFDDTGYLAGLEAGEFQFTGYILAYGKTINAFHQGRKLDDLAEDLQKYLLFTRKVKHQLSTDNIFGALLITANLRSINNYVLSFDAFETTESEYLKACKENRSNAALAFYLTVKAFVLYLHGQTEKALASILEAKEVLDYIRGVVTTAEHNFYHSLILSSLYADATIEEQDNYLKTIKNNQKQMKTWKDACPENFFHKYILIKAELARLDGRIEDAMFFYEQAIKSAAENEYIQNEALANELYAQFWLLREKNEIAELYMKKAHYGYQIWGALRKKEQIEKKFPVLVKGARMEFFPGKTTTSAGDTSYLIDLASVIKASQTISGEIELTSLLAKLMEIVMENAGAEKGILILAKDEDLMVEAQTYADKAIASIFESVSLAECGNLSPAIVHYVSRTRESVVLDNASEKGMFVRDAYVKKIGPRSVLCVPVLLHGDLIGVLYLENNETIAAFTSDRVETLTLLSSQAAISIENARLYTKYRSLYDNAVEGIYQSKRSGRFISVNPAMSKIMGYSSPEALLEAGTGFLKEMWEDPEDLKIFEQLLETDGEVIGFETRIFRKDKSKIWISVSAHSVCDSKGNILYYEGSLLNINSRREKEEEERRRIAAEAANAKIMESIGYAKIIQSSLLPDMSRLKTHLPHCFFIWKPKDIVGGDIIYSDFFEDGFILAVIDCTGHGVPGAFMTMLASTGMKRIIGDEGNRDPAVILKRLNFIVKTSLKQDTSHARSDDGLDASVCFVKPDENILTFAGAKLPLLYVENGKLSYIKGDRCSIGYKRSNLNFNFKSTTIKLNPSTSFYMHSDGFPDQLGGPRGIRYGNRRLRTQLEKNALLPFDEQRDILVQDFEKYHKETERIDDVTLVGFGVR